MQHSKKWRLIIAKRLQKANNFLPLSLDALAASKSNAVHYWWKKAQNTLRIQWIPMTMVIKGVTGEVSTRSSREMYREIPAIPHAFPSRYFPCVNKSSPHELLAYIPRSPGIPHLVRWPDPSLSIHVTRPQFTINILGTCICIHCW